MTENENTPWEEQLMAATPREVRALAADIPQRAPTAEPIPRAPAEPSPGPSDGGTASEPPASIDLQHERDGARVRAEARRIAGRSR
jgi:hypothetical protein